MKTLLVTLALFFSVSVLAEDGIDFLDRATASYQTQSPAGEQVSCFPQKQVETWKKRRKAKKVEPKIVEKVVEKIVEKEVTVEKIVEKTVEIEPYKNRVRLLGGIGPTGAPVSTLPNYVLFSQHYSVVGGLGYERSLNKRWSVGADAFTNKMLVIEIGYGF